MDFGVEITSTNDDYCKYVRVVCAFRFVQKCKVALTVFGYRSAKKKKGEIWFRILEPWQE